MKLLNKFIFGSAIIASFGALQACSDEENTLNGSDDIYIELTPSSFELTAGDTIQLNARVSNVSGSTIDTPIEWTVDDESIAKVVDIVRYERVKTPKSRAEGDETNEGDVNEGEGEGGDNGEGDNGEGGGDNGDVQEPTTPEPPKAEYREVRTKGIVGINGAQGKNTVVRATLENGRFAVAPVSVVYRSSRNALAAISSNKRSYQRQPNDTVWFSLNPIQLFDEFEADYEITLTDVYPGLDRYMNPQPLAPEDSEFTFINENKKENFFVDEENSRIGVIYTAPRLCGKAVCKVTLKNDQDEISAESPILIYPKVSPGFEMNGKRPLAQESNPSNLKYTLISEAMDINSTHLVGVCLGIEGFWDQDIFNAFAAEQNGMFNWEVNGSSVIVDEMYADFDYQGGFVSYIKVRSGMQEGLTVIKYVMPDTTLTCNLSVENYNVRHPVDRIVTTINEEEVDEVTFTIGQPASMEISVAPDASFSYHIPEVVAQDPTIVRVEERGENEGYTRRFTALKPGVTYLNIKALDKTKTVKVTVVDAISRVTVTPNAAASLLIGQTLDLQANVYMASNSSTPLATLVEDVEWTVSDPTIASIEKLDAKGGKIRVTALAEGNVTIQATSGGRQSNEVSVEVKAITDVTITEGEAYIFQGDDIEHIGLSIDDFYVEFPATYDADNNNFACTATGTTTVLSYDGNDYDDCQFTITITKGDNDNEFVINATFILPNGMKIFVTNVVAAVE